MCLAKGGGGVGWGGGSKDREQTLPLCYLEPGEYPEISRKGRGLKSD